MLSSLVVRALMHFSMFSIRGIKLKSIHTAQSNKGSCIHQWSVSGLISRPGFARVAIIGSNAGLVQIIKL